MAAILKLRDENGNVYEVPALVGKKGDQGDKGDKGDTGERGPQGIQGPSGKNLEFAWNGTQLGVRQEGQSSYQYVNLKGEKGDKGDKGEKGDRGDPGEKGEKGDKGDPGSIDNLTKMHVTDALGYTPLPISNGVLENYREKLVTLSGTSTTINLSLGNVFTHTLSGNTTYSITNAVNNQAHSFTLIITQTGTVRTLTFPASVKWQGGEIPDLSTASKTYILTFVTINGGTTWLGMFGGEFNVS